MKKIFAVVFLCMATFALWGQNEVSLVVSGEGKNKEEATLNAFRSAIEQTYGTFVSANTTVQNDQLVVDEIVSLSSGYIQKHNYLSENKMPDGNTFVTLSVTVSIDKLVSFAESKGMKTVVQGSLYAMTIKKMNFDKDAEEKAVENLCKQLEVFLPTLFDYEIKGKLRMYTKNKYDYGERKEPVKDPDHENDFEVFVSPTENLLTFYTILVNTLNKIKLSNSEIENYKSINRPLFTFRTGYLNEGFGYISEAVSHQIKTKKAKGAYSIDDFNRNFWRQATFRSSKSVDLLNDLIDKSLIELYHFVISDDLRDFEVFVSTINSNSGVKVQLPAWLKVGVSDVLRKNSIGYYLNAKMTRGDKIGIGHYLLLLDVSGRDFSDQFASSDNDRYLNDYFHPDNYHCRPNSKNNDTCSGLHLIRGKLFYEEAVISKITQLSVSKPSNPNIVFSNESAPLEATDRSQAEEEVILEQSKLPLYNDTLQQAVNDYNAFLKHYPYNYNENHIEYSLSSELPNDENVLRDTLHALLQIISDKKAQLIERYKKDSIEFDRMSLSLQEKINEANEQLLKYPYNLQKLTLKDSLSFKLFGKPEKLDKEFRNKMAAIPKMQEQIEKRAYMTLMTEDPQRFTEIYFTQNPSKKLDADKTYIECRCKYKYRLDFDMAFIQNTLPDCDCREKEYQTVSDFFHSREDFDQMYSQSESIYKRELNNLKIMMADKRDIERILSDNKKLNFKRAILTTNEDLNYIMNRINWHKGKYYYTDVIDAVFNFNDKLSKEWSKNGSYFNSKTEMFEYWIGKEYGKVLKARKNN